MNKTASILIRIVAAALICASVSACSSPVASGGSFPVYGTSTGAASQGSYSPGSSIMDY